MYVAPTTAVTGLVKVAFRFNLVQSLDCVKAESEKRESQRLACGLQLPGQKLVFLQSK